MKIITSGNLKNYLPDFYIQTLSMLFFPDDSVFGRNSASHNYIEFHIDGRNVSNENTKKTENIDIYVKICYNKKVISKTALCTHACDNPDDLKRHLVIEAGKIFYAAAAELTEINPPWGVHTGIRPAKAAEKALKDAEWDVNRAVGILTEKYLMDVKKAKIAVDTCTNAKRAVDFYDKTHGNGKSDFSLYISIPFCPTKCRYCSFTSYSTPKLLKLIPDYMQTLLREIEIAGAESKEKNLTLRTVYIGGGTPTTLDFDSLELLLRKIELCFDLSNIIEYTVEAGRPDTITKEKLALFYKFGVTRVSINPQTLDDEILKSIGRKHTAEDFFRAYEAARESGIKNINADCIAGLFGESPDGMIDTVKRLTELAPENITVHTLCVKKSAAIKTESTAAGKDKSDILYKPYAPEINDALEIIYEILYKNGYLPYYMYKQKYSVGNLENTGFSKKSRECMYNIYMMDELHTVCGTGAGAMTKIVYPDGRIERAANDKYPYEYIRQQPEKFHGKFL